MDVSETHPVAVAFRGGVAGGRATRWRLLADSIAAGNEFEQAEPQVNLVEDEIERFRSGHRFQMPPHSATALQWRVK